MAAAADSPRPELPPTTSTAPKGPETATTAPTDSAPADITLPPPPKRQRRPSVRLGDIGEQSAYETHHQIRRSKPPWRIHKESSKSVKARSITNLVNGNDSENQHQEIENQNGDVFFTHRKKASKRGKRVRSNWMTSSSKVENNDHMIEDDYREELGEFEQESPSPLHSNDNTTWQRRVEVRVSDSEGMEMENCYYPERAEGVRTWLIELGLSRYAPVFEVHEVDGEVLPLLTLEDLKDMGINAVGSRRKLCSAIQKLRKGFS